MDGARHLIEDSRLHQVRLNILRSIPEAGEAPADLSRHSNLHIQVLSKVPRETCVALECASSQDHIQVVFLRDLLGQVSVVDHAHSCNLQPISNSFLHRCGQGCLESGTTGDLLCDMDTARANINKVDGALISEATGEFYSVLELPALLVREAVFKPVGTGKTEEYGHIGTDEIAPVLAATKP